MRPVTINLARMSIGGSHRSATGCYNLEWLGQAGPGCCSSVPTLTVVVVLAVATLRGILAIVCLCRGAVALVALVAVGLGC